MTDVNFDEFQAIRRRKAQDDEEDEDQKEEPATTPKAEEDEEPDGLAERAGAFAELPEVQLLLCVAILADVAGAALTAARDDGAPAFLVRAAAAFPGFVNFLYAFELLALATAFKLRMLTHPGLLLDVERSNHKLTQLCHTVNYPLRLPGLEWYFCPVACAAAARPNSMSRKMRS